MQNKFIEGKESKGRERRVFQFDFYWLSLFLYPLTSTTSNDERAVTKGKRDSERRPWLKSSMPAYLVFNRIRRTRASSSRGATRGHSGLLYLAGKNKNANDAFRNNWSNRDWLIHLLLFTRLSIVVTETHWSVRRSIFIRSIIEELRWEIIWAKQEAKAYCLFSFVWKFLIKYHVDLNFQCWTRLRKQLFANYVKKLFAYRYCNRL